MIDDSVRLTFWLFWIFYTESCIITEPKADYMHI